jgi:hypothetical protein
MKWFTRRARAPRIEPYVASTPDAGDSPIERFKKIEAWLAEGSAVVIRLTFRDDYGAIAMFDRIQKDLEDGGLELALFLDEVS